MLDENLINKLSGMVIAEMAGGEGEFISARDLYTAGLKAGLEMAGAEPERRAPTLKVMNDSFAKLNLEDKHRSLTHLAESLNSSGPERAARLTKLLNTFGYSWGGVSIVPVGVLDERERELLPLKSADEISKAVDRLARGDESGAISSACGAIDLVTSFIYEKHGLGDAAKTSFSAKVNTALQKLGIFQGMKAEFVAVGMSQSDADEAAGELEKAINHASQALQILRRRMGDVHGSRPALKRTAYDCIKFASAICALFEPM